MLEKLNLQLKDPGQQSIYMLMDGISMESCRDAINWIFECNYAEKPLERMTLLICSPGGDLNAAFALIDVMRGSSIPITTIGLGQIASAGLLIFIAGQKGKRILTPNTSILSHQYTWGSFGKEHELFAQVKEFDLTTKRLIAHYKKCTDLSEQDIRSTLLPPQDVWLSSVEAKKLGICDHVRDIN